MKNTIILIKHRLGLIWPPAWRRRERLYRSWLNNIGVMVGAFYVVAGDEQGNVVERVESLVAALDVANENVEHLRRQPGEAFAASLEHHEEHHEREKDLQKEFEASEARTVAAKQAAYEAVCSLTGLMKFIEQLVEAGVDKETLQAPWLHYMNGHRALTAFDRLKNPAVAEPHWEAVPDDDYGMWRVRWSQPDAEGRWYYVRHYPGTLWGRHVVERDADQFNKEGRRPEEFRNHVGQLTEAAPEAGKAGGT